MLEQFLAGDVTYTQVSQARQAEFRQLAQERGFQVFEYPDNGFVFMGMNSADPTNPQNGLDADGNAIDQGHHPIFGDPRVRIAIRMALDMDAIIDGAANGEGLALASHANPNSWSYNDELQPRPQDVEGALALLAEAGWVDADNDPSTPLVAQGALYAPDGTEFKFNLITNAGNQVRESVATIVQDQLSQIGIAVDFQAIDFNVVIDNFVGQTFDAVILGWGFSFPDNPDDPTANFDPANDIVGSGFNATSYNNPEVTDLLAQARSLPGCNPEERLPLYSRVQEILYDEQPWIWFFQPNVMWVAQANVANWSPFPGHPNQIRWNLDAMSITP
jgi:peptide/nickel transport system substrate-binding protein